MFGSVKHSSQSLFKSLVEISLILFVVTGCNLKKPVTETPMENPQNISKDFFVDPKTNVSKTFIFAMQSESEGGRQGEYYAMHGAQMVDNANLVFEVQESQLVGKLVHPSFPNNPEKWEIALSIPIKSHYYFEKKKDEFGRESNEYIENSSRSHWSARPFMKLDLAGITIFRSSIWNDWISYVVHSIKDIEWDTKNNFLGFSATTSVATRNVVNNKAMVQLRLNMMAFEHNKNFKKTAFVDENYKYMNILHLMGEKYDGTKQALYAAHWDLSKSHKIVLYGFPNEETKEIARTVVKDWNKTLEKIGATKPGIVPFVIDETAKPTHALDIRHKTIYWVDDKRISEFSPLGIGLAISDLKNGEILWGGITLYGGLIQEYLNRNLSPSANIQVGKVAQAQFQDRLNLKSSLLKIPAFLDEASQKVSLYRTESVMRELLMKDAVEKSKKHPQFDLKAADLHAQSASVQFTTEYLNEISKIKIDAQNLLQPNYLNTVLGLNVRLTDSQSQSEELKYERKTSSQIVKEIKEKTMLAKSGLDYDRTVAMMASEWGIAFAQGKVNVTKEAALKSLIKELISHEYGHFLGLGHQFKENILPQKGTVPDSIYNTLKQRSTDEAGRRQFSSVMGYRSPLSEFITPFDEIVPGPQDELSLRFLYKMEVPTYKAGDADFKFTVIDDGKIPTSINGEKVSYFPQCNDTDASLSLDPYCNRFDRGSNAKEIVEGYFKNINDNIIQSHIAFSDARMSDPDEKDAGTFYKAMSNLGRIRLFYDFMRHRYKKVFESMASDKNLLYDFSATCLGTASNEKINTILDANPELKDLCIANATAIKGFTNLISLPLSDYTKVDIDNRFSPGGLDAGDADRNYSKVFGTWTEAGARYLKILALYALKTPRPWMDWWGMWTVPSYDNPDHRYSYASVYPLESTKLISDMINSNLKFKARGDEKTLLGQSVLMAGLFSDMDLGSNDTGRFPSDYLQEIKKQTEFGFNMKALIVTKPSIYANETNVKSFQGSVYDFSSGSSEPISEVFVLPGGYLIAYDEKSFLLPLTQMKFYKDTDAYVFALQISYTSDDNTKISSLGAKKVLQELHLEIINTCLDGYKGNGLRGFFKDNNPEFKGFEMMPMISREKDMYDKFIESIKVSFDKYEASSLYPENKPSRVQCLEAVKGIGNIVATSAILQGYFTQQLIENLEK